MGRTAVRAALAVIGLVVIAAAAGALWVWDRYTRPGPLLSARAVVIEKGAGLAAIAERLAAAGVVTDATVFRLGVRVDALGRRLRAGEYEFPTRVSMRGAATIIASGRTVVRRLTVAEGLTTRAALALVATAEGLDGPLPDPAPGEGALMPETYFYSWGDSRAAVVARMEHAMETALAALWADRAAGLAIDTREQALVLASLIEKETGRDDERARVSAVFHNRLRRGMRLQSDPTVVYALAGGKGALDRPLTREDLAVDSPYNTYTRRGLPPAPIANPGRASIAAALHPAAANDLYFVADGSGGHLFARTLAEHNRNVARLRRLLRQQRQNGSSP